MTFALTLVFVMAGGSLGALARFLGQRFAANHTSWPGWVPILIINVLGSLMIGAAVAWLSLDIKALKLEDLSPFDRASDTLALNDLIALIAVGFCGAFTTFSTFSLDNYFLSIENKGHMLINMIATTALAYGAVMIGWHLGTMAAGS